MAGQANRRYRSAGTQERIKFCPIFAEGPYEETMGLLDAKIVQQILDSLPLGVYVVTPDHRVLFWNKAAETITGFSASDVGVNPNGDHAPAPEGGRPMPVCSTQERLLACTSGRAEPAEESLFARHKDGHHFAVQVRSIPLRDDTGKVQAIAEVFESQKEESAPNVAQPSVAAEPVKVFGVPSLADSEHYLDSKLRSPGTLGVFIVEVESIHEMVRQRGLDMVHACERALVHHWETLVPSPHFLGRWHDRRFLIAMPNPTVSRFEQVRAQLSRPEGTVSVVWWGDRVPLHLKIRGAIVHDLWSMQRLTWGENSLAQAQRG